MTSEREATVWLSLGLGMMVWACTMIGCQAGPAGPSYTVTVLDDAMPGTAVSSSTSASMDAAKAPAFRVATAGWDSIFALVDEGVGEVRSRVTDDRDNEAAAGWLSGGPSASGTWPLAEAARLSLQAPFESNHLASAFGTARSGPPVPLPAGAMMGQDWQAAKFDAAGCIGLTVGALLVLFGGEAVVLILQRRHECAVNTSTLIAEVQRQPRRLLHVDEVIAPRRPEAFRLPSVSETPTQRGRVDDRPYRRAA